MEEVSCKPGLVAATFSADLLDDQLGVPLHEELYNNGNDTPEPEPSTYPTTPFSKIELKEDVYKRQV